MNGDPTVTSRSRKVGAWAYPPRCPLPHNEPLLDFHRRPTICRAANRTCVAATLSRLLRRVHPGVKTGDTIREGRWIDVCRAFDLRDGSGKVTHVEPDRLHDPEHGAPREDVGRGKHAGVLLDDRCCAGVSPGVKKSTYRSPRIVAVVLKERCRVDADRAFLTLASISAMYCWCSNRVRAAIPPRLDRS